MPAPIQTVKCMPHQWLMQKTSLVQAVVKVPRALIAAALLILMVTGCGAGGGGNTGLSLSSGSSSISATVSPSAATVITGQKATFIATVYNATSTTVTWQVNGVTGGDSTHGTIDTNGNYTAPAAVPSPAAVTVIRPWCKQAPVIPRRRPSTLQPRLRTLVFLRRRSPCLPAPRNRSRHRRAG